MIEPRLVPSPIFILSPVRSGSTLLRCLLNSHPDICAPHELHLSHLHVELENEYIQLAMDTAGLKPAELQHMLWDRILARLLAASGKRQIVDKSPSNVWIWRRLVECWPDARFIVLRRNPAAIVDSIVRADDGRDRPEATRQVTRFVNAIDQADQALHGTLAIRYEQLTTAPEETCRRICEALDVPWYPTMIDYGKYDHGPFVYGIGDWSRRIQSGTVHPPRQDPTWSGLTDELQDLCRRWDYAPA